VIDRVPRLRGVGDHAKERLRDQKIQHLDYAHTEGCWRLCKSDTTRRRKVE